MNDLDQKAPQLDFGGCDDGPGIVFEFYSELVELCNEHIKSNKAVRERFNVQGCALPRFAVLYQIIFDDDEVDSADADNDVSGEDDI